MPDTLIENVSDTALWVAYYRMLESQRPDAVFKDTLAEKLVGEKGRLIAHSMPSQKQMAFVMTVRTVAIDRLIDTAIKAGIDTVINLGAGLDTRPYRMKLPAYLRWIEIDFDPMIRYKNERLAQEKPVCHLERISADISNDQVRRDLFQRLDSEVSCALIITEGVIPYLTNDQAAHLSEDLYKTAHFQYWIQDYRRGAMVAPTERQIAKKLQSTSPFLFNVPDTLKFFQEHGWMIKENSYLLDEAQRIGRSLPFIFPWTLLWPLLPKIIRNMGNKAYGIVMFAKEDQKILR
jgi:methyltransferase (TIGR00027 family)